ncbi:MAG TPA: alkaline phosphatase family protein [Thermoplasmata archaeon]|nr:alkaline phosphatase family protein [Thermoplasmata archaeon]
MLRSPSRVLVLGLDGGTFDLLDPWFAAGELPYLRSLATEGLSARLTSVYPAKTIPAWYSFATGLDPGALGVFGFTAPDGGPGRSRIVQTFRPAEAVWDALSRRGRRVGVVNFPLRSGYPVNGFFLPGMLTDRPNTHPAELRSELEEELGEPIGAELPPFRDADRAGWMTQAVHLVEQRGRIGELLCRRPTPDFLFVLFRETDRVQHQLWSELVRGPAQAGSDLVAFWRALDDACARIDHAFREAGGPAVTLVISDHGHGAARSDFFTNRWLESEGYLKFRGASDVRRDIASRVLVGLDRFQSLRRPLRAVVDRLGSSRPGAAMGTFVTGDPSFEATSARIDWERTEAFSYPVPEGIYLNRWNRSLTPARQAVLLQEIRAKLDSFAGAKVETFLPSELYRGRNFAGAPDLLIRVDGLETELRMDFAYPHPHLRERPSYFYGCGVHRMDGILLASGPGGAPVKLNAPMSLLDVAPTVLELMGLPVPADRPGRSFAGYLGGPASAPEPAGPVSPGP